MIAIGGAIVTGAFVAVEVVMHRHRNHRGGTTA
jgi:amino acid permease